MRRDQLTILLAEDDDGHALLVERNLRRAGITNHIVRVTDGHEALEYVHAQGAHARRPRGPLMMLLDIRMPRLDGIEVLRRLKADATTCTIPVVMLTTTDNPQEISLCYELGCNVYVTKPVAYDDLMEALRRLSLFLSIVTVPNESRQGGSVA